MATNSKRQLALIQKRVAAMGSRWQALLKPAIDRIDSNIKSGLSVEKAVAEAWSATGASKVISSELKKQTLEAAYLAAGGVEAVYSRPAFEQAILGSKWAGDITTIKRLNGASAQMRRAVTDTIRGAVVRGESVRTLALKIADGFHALPMVPTNVFPADALPAKLADLISRSTAAGVDPKLIGDLRNFRNRYVAGIGGRFPDTSRLGAAYRDLTIKLETGTAAQISRAISAAVNQKARYIGERIARTEMGRAHWESFAATKLDDPQVAAIRFRLSSDHPHEDICDLITSVDNGWGAGVYRRDSLPPYPFHPNCICWYEEIFIAEVAGKNYEGGAAPVKRLLNSVPAASRAAMMGAQYRADEFKKNPSRVLQQVAQYQKPRPLKPVILPNMLSE